MEYTFTYLKQSKNKDKNVYSLYFSEKTIKGTVPSVDSARSGSFPAILFPYLGPIIVNPNWEYQKYSGNLFYRKTGRIVLQKYFKRFRQVLSSLHCL